MSAHTYKNLIFTKHGLQRMQQRSIDAESIASVVNAPYKSFAHGNDKTKFIKTLKARRVHVVAQWKEAEQKWLVISVWVRGENDRESLIVQLILAPFRLAWWMIRKALR